jgi:hypothetical protein
VIAIDIASTILSKSIVGNPGKSSACSLISGTWINPERVEDL